MLPCARQQECADCDQHRAAQRAARQLAQVEAEQVDAVEHQALPDLQDADDRVDQQRGI